MSIKNVLSYSENIIKAYNESKTNVFIGNVLVTNIKINIYLNVIDGTYDFAYPVMRVDIGDGLVTYLFRLLVSLNSTIILVFELTEIGEL